MKVGLVSLGCVKNQVDAEQMLSLLLGEGGTLDILHCLLALVLVCLGVWIVSREEAHSVK